ncbi:hypothetical protein H6F88_01330 [Oculatella sp. FACHB-28]|nr:hypothetical protein [Oculatella sp. FACHB-28]MBD2054683.1 hypothetical protein [Oculatella sp. FACHB-28]
MQRVVKRLEQAEVELMPRRSPNAADPKYWLDIEKCKARDSVIPARRSA